MTQGASCPATGGGLAAAAEYKPDKARRAKILQAARMRHPGFALWRRLRVYGCSAAFASAAVSYLLFGRLLRAEPLVMAGFWLLLLSVCFVALLYGAVYFRGHFTCWDKASKEVLLLREDELIYSLDAAGRLPRKRESYHWTMPYEKVARADYDRAFKRLRVYGRFDEECSRKPPPGKTGLPQGMTRLPPSGKRKDGEVYLDIPLYYEGSPELLARVEELCGVYIRPAVRGDDAADLRDLPGLRAARPVLRPLAAFTLAAAVALLTLAGQLRREAEENPWQPYPLTSEQTLVTTHKVGETALLDGCFVTLESAEPGKDGGMLLSFFWENGKDNPPLLLHLDKNTPNFLVYAVMPDGSAELCSYIVPSERLVKIMPGGQFPCEMLFSLPPEAIMMRVEFNSDRWASDGKFWTGDYLGRETLINGKAYLHNRVLFQFGVNRVR
ncbi:MAG: hypothetical protein LBI44_03875 [Oscillospiraceae bacterium]|jgi:hypothetical protein|nr:hypothetical protein [Oscillospiraceae bacterium]